ncbi:L-fucose/L-arabinose isomerase family protein [Phycisphaerales bacterium AB-hyl4]|uniref:L-fucose/L-arabinose isomerase family protein n=1 Tax=Natronomicrosphaera hydrolytica TaxID=3242702 RepID=A0ABV4U2V2_9BACT
MTDRMLTQEGGGTRATDGVASARRDQEINLPAKGVTTEVLHDLLGPPPTTRPVPIAVVGCCIRAHFPYETAVGNYRAACDRVRQVLDASRFEVLTADEPFEDPDALLAFADGLLERGVAGVIFLHATYTAGEIGSHFGRWLADHRMPVLSWSLPDEKGGNLEANSLCCQNFLLNMWQRMNVRYVWHHTAIDATADPYIQRFGASVRAKARLRHGKALHVGGSRVSAFYDGETDELAVMRRFGLRFDRIDLEAAHQHGKKFADADVSRLWQAIKSHEACNRVALPDEQALRTLRMGLSIYDLSVSGGYIGCTVKSWPELFDCYGFAIDGAVSMLNDAGLCTVEEGDMNGLISSLAMHLLTDGAAVPTMMDLSTLDVDANRLGIWHCGACPTRLLRAGATFDATRHSILENGDPETAVGLMLEFPLVTGPATVVRYQSPDASTMFAFEGRLEDCELAFRGNYTEMTPESPATAESVMGTIMNRGLDHHWSLGMGHLGRDLEMLNHWLGVKAIGEQTSMYLSR